MRFTPFIGLRHFIGVTAFRELGIFAYHLSTRSLVRLHISVIIISQYHSVVNPDKKAAPGRGNGCSHFISDMNALALWAMTLSFSYVRYDAA